MSQRSGDFFSAANSRSRVRWWRWRRDFLVESDSEVVCKTIGAVAVEVGGASVGEDDSGLTGVRSAEAEPTSDPTGFPSSGARGSSVGVFSWVLEGAWGRG